MKKATLYLSSGLLTLAIIIVSINAALAFISVGKLNDSQYSVAHTWQVIDTVDRVMSSLKDAESGNRGFLLTGDQAYLDPYINARKELTDELDSLQKLIADNPQQRPRVVELRAIIDSRLQLLQQGIEERSVSDLDAVRPLILNGTGKYDMDRARALAAIMDQTEQDLLVERRHFTASAARRASSTVLIASTLDLLLIVFASWFLVREKKLRLFSDQTRHRLQMLQLISDVALTQLPVAELSEELLKRVRRLVEADATVLATWRDGEMVVEASDGVSIRPGTRLATGLDNPVRRAAVENRVVTVDRSSPSLLDSATSALFESPLEAWLGLTQDNKPSSAAPGSESASSSSSESSQASTSLWGASAPGTSPLLTLLIFPLSAAGKVTGILVAGRRTPDAFALEDEDLLRVVADRIAIALDRASTYESVRALNAELEERVALRTSELEAINRELEAFSYSVSHDLRAPLRTVDGFSLALQEDYSARLDAEGLDFVRRIRDGVQRMGQLIDALLQLSRITRAQLIREPVDISEMAGALAVEFQQQNEARTIDFRIQPGLRANADPGLLRVALENLMGNAVKFTGKQAAAVIEVGQSPNAGEFYIRDNGAGFDMQYGEKLFIAFQRLHGEKDFKGSGIGLATVARVIRRHHGSIRAEGSVDQGATFWFTLG